MWELAGVSKAVVEALEAICKEHDGMEATIRAGNSHIRQCSTACSSTWHPFVEVLKRVMDQPQCW